MKMIRPILLLILVSVSGVLTSVAGQTNLPNTVPSSPVPRATSTPPATISAVPSSLQDPVLYAQILAKLGAETMRADFAERKAADLATNRDEWKETARLNGLRADTLQISLDARSKEATELRVAQGFMTTSLQDYRDKVKDLTYENKQLRASRKWYLTVGAVVGGVIAVAVMK